MLPKYRNRFATGKAGRTARTVCIFKPRLCSPRKNFGVFGALLIQVISGDHFKGISQVGNLSVVTAYIDSVAPPVMYTVRTPTLKPIRMTVTLLAIESTSENQGIVRNRINGYLNASARPGVRCGRQRMQFGRYNVSAALPSFPEGKLVKKRFGCATIIK